MSLLYRPDIRIGGSRIIPLELDFLSNKRLPDNSQVYFGLLAALQAHMEKFKGMLHCQVKVNTNINFVKAFRATGRQPNINPDVIRHIPLAKLSQPIVFFFGLDRFVNHLELAGEYYIRGLEPVDPITLAIVNAADKSFADDNTNITHWADDDGNIYCVKFGWWNGQGQFSICRCTDEQHADLLFAGNRDTNRN